MGSNQRDQSLAACRFDRGGGFFQELTVFYGRCSVAECILQVSLFRKSVDFWQGLSLANEFLNFLEPLLYTFGLNFTDFSSFF